MKGRGILLGLVAIGLLTLWVSGPAAAHAQFVTSTPPSSAILPSAPAQITVTLSEAVQSGTGTIRVTNSSGGRIPVSPVTYPSDGRTLSVSMNRSGPGIYTVTWSAVSAVDGHFTAGSFSYGVQNPDGSLPGPVPGSTVAGPPVSPLEVALRSIGFLGLAVAFGIGVMANFMWLPAGRDPSARECRAYGVAFPILLNVGRVAAFVFAASMVGLFVLATGLEGTSAAQGLAASPYVQSVTARVALGVVMFALLSRAFAQSRGGKPEASAWSTQASTVLAVAGIVVGSIGTHAAAAGPGLPAIGALGVAADGAHFAGIGLWLGGLVGIFAVRPFFREPEAAPLARIVLGRFSRMAAYAVGLVLVGGIVLSILLVGTLDALIVTPYGWVVLGKIALFAPMVGLGAFNRYRLIPKTAEEPEPTQAIRQIVRNVRFETGIGIAALVLAGLLTSMTPAASATLGPSGQFALETVKDGLRVHFEVYPYPTTPGVYVVTFILSYASNGTPFLFGKDGKVRFTLTGSGNPPVFQNLSGPHGDHFVNSTTAFSSPGIWKLDASFRRFDNVDLLVTFYVTIRAGG
jgi:copper transport protein